MCRIKGCYYKKKYRRLGDSGSFVSCSTGDHNHPISEILSDQRGLSGEQKLIIEQAFAEDRKSSPDILAFFRSKRSLSDESMKASFPPDPEISKLNNYIQEKGVVEVQSYSERLRGVVHWTWSIDGQCRR